MPSCNIPHIQSQTLSQICVGYINIYHLYNKLLDVNMLLNNQPYIHLLGISETRLNADHCESVLNIPSYLLIRKDSQSCGQTGMAV